MGFQTGTSRRPATGGQSGSDPVAAPEEEDTLHIGHSTPVRACSSNAAVGGSARPRLSWDIVDFLRGGNRRWLFAGSTTIIVLLIIGVSQLPWFRDKTSPECVPVRDMLAFNASEGKRIGAQENPTQADYRAWADGLADRSGKVTDATLAGHAIRLSTYASQFASGYALMPQSTRPGQKPPDEYYRLNMLNQQILDETKQLEDLCPAPSGFRIPFIG